LKTEYTHHLTQANQEKDLLKKTFQRLKSKKTKEVDDTFHQLHNKAFQKIDCLACANCCKTTSPIFRDVDIKRISKHLRLKENQFIS
jgi:hypothetical protein